MFKILVPATTANIGPGFDSIGIALNLFNTIEVEEMASGLVIEAFGRDSEIIETDERNLVYRSIMMCLNRVGYRPKGLHIKLYNEIPVSRGLGSSAACIVGGLLAGNQLANCPLAKEEILELAVEMEGHPDNVAPALLGGMVVSAKGQNRTKYVQIPIKTELEFYAAIPNVGLSTKLAREALPESVDFKDAVFNVGRAALLVAALAMGDYDKLAYGLQDRLHQPYRLPLMTSIKKIFDEAAQKELNNIFLSGAGPTIIYLSWNKDKREVEAFKEIVKGCPEDWRIEKLRVYSNNNDNE